MTLGSTLYGGIYRRGAPDEYRRTLEKPVYAQKEASETPLMLKIALTERHDKKISDYFNGLLDSSVTTVRE